MRSFSATRAKFYHPTKIHPALTSFADECSGMLARLVAYVGTLALLAIIGIHFWDELPVGEAAEPAARPGWNRAPRSHPAFAFGQFDSSGKTGTYEIFRHPEGGRKDVFRWAGSGEKPVAEVEIYRPGGESSQTGPAIAEIAAPMDPEGVRELEAAGVIDSKFGAVALLRLVGRTNDPQSCLAFVKRLEEPNLRISGWSCQGDGLPARRAAISCILNKLTLLTAGNDPKLAELFARTELRRGSCSASSAAPAAADWVTAAENPLLRGRL